VIIESIVTTQNADGKLNIAPMGAAMTDPELAFFELRPFKSSITFENLQRTGQGVLHITDDCSLVAKTALDLPLPELDIVEAEVVVGKILCGCCRAYEFSIKHADLFAERATFTCRVECAHRFRDFVGFNRARHAVVEAAILASRIDFIPIEEIREQLDRFRAIVEKTGDAMTTDALNDICDFVASRVDPTPPDKDKRPCKNY